MKSRIYIVASLLFLLMSCGAPESIKTFQKYPLEKSFQSPTLKSGPELYSSPAIRGISKPVYWVYNHKLMKIINWKNSRFGISDIWLAKELESIFKTLKSSPLGIKAIKHIGMYSYRKIKGSNKLSRHARGLALDISEFTLGDGTILSVEKDWASPQKRRQLIEIRNMFCRKFDTVLSPFYNKDHYNHFHVDLNPKYRAGRESPLPKWENLDPLPKSILASLKSFSSSSVFSLQSASHISSAAHYKTCK